MLKIHFYQETYSNGKKQYVESLHFGTATWGTNRPKISVDNSLLGQWLSDFLSTNVAQSEQFISQYNIDDKERKDCIYAHRLFDNFLNYYPITLSAYQKYMIHTHISMPKFNYRLNSNGIVEEIYNCSDIIEICTVLLHQALKNKCTFKICQHCYKWFVPNNKSDEKYCLRPSPRLKGKNCRDAARYIKILNKRHSDEATRLIKNIRQMYDNSDEDKTRLNEANNEWKKKLKARAITNDQYVEWLKSNYKRKYSK